MLKFLQDRPEDASPPRSPIKYQPNMCYGNSYETPQEFQTPHTIYQASSYINPFLRFEPKRADIIPINARTSVEPRWTRKANLSLIEEHKIVGQPEEEVSPPKSRYLQSFHKQFQADPRRFRLTRGQFTDFIEKNNHYKSIGPLQGIERTDARIKDRQQSVWIKSPSKREQMTASLRYATSLNTTVKSSIAENSELLTQKIRIRRNRQYIQKAFRKGLEDRKKLNTSQKFQLPRQGPQHEIYLVDDGLQARYGRISPKKKEGNLDQLQKFEGKLCKMFK